MRFDLLSYVPKKKSVWICVLVLAGASATAWGQQERQRWYEQQPQVAASQAQGDSSAETAEPTAARQLLQEGPAAEWIWGPRDDRRYVLHKRFAGPSRAGYLLAACDNAMVVFINGRRVTSSDDWQQPVLVDIQKYLLDGQNEIMFEVSNAGGAAGLAAKLAWVGKDGEPRYLVTDASWHAIDKQQSDQTAPVRSLGKMGVAPWRNVFSSAGSAPASPRDLFQVVSGFQVESLFSVPRESLGSWVCIALDDKGRILASDQGDKGICRITPAPAGSQAPTRVEHLEIPITSAQGMLYAFDSLYLSVNGGPGSGLYRARDTNDDDQYDEVVKLTEFRGGGEHGPHALRLSPDGQSIYVICGNHTDPPRALDGSRIPTNWGEDLLLPRQWDARGHARGRLAPGGWIAKTDPDGKTWELFSIGYRNAYDMDFNADGELFAYDADMEWDLGMPWYRPTRAVHATSGSEFGWRSGTGKWPAYYADSLPPLVNVGPGSPVGATFGYGSRFPAKYQRAMFLCDWTFGTMYAVHITPEGASYTADIEEFVARTPLPLTDVLIGTDGAMYFTIGGRGTQSELFRVTYVGDADTEPVNWAHAEGRELRQLRRELETFHGDTPDPQQAIATLWPHLGHADRHIRYAARVALEHQPVELWREKAVELAGPHARITAVIALARQAETDASDGLLAALLGALPGGDFAALELQQQLEWARACQLVMIRHGAPAAETAQQVLASLGPHYPAAAHALNRELSQILVFLDDPHVVSKTIPLLAVDTRKTSTAWDTLLTRNAGYGRTIAEMLANQPDAERLHLAFVLRNAKVGWSLEQRQKYFEFLRHARQWSGGASYLGFLENIDNEAYLNATDSERLAIEATGARQPYRAPELPPPAGPGEQWTKEKVAQLFAAGLRGRNFENGKRTFSAARCVLCHRFGGEGGATGPDLTQVAGRFNPQDLTEAMVEPSKVISDQYRAMVVATDDGQTVTGRIVTEDDTTITVLVDPEDATKVAVIAKDSIESTQPSPTSLMPQNLLNELNADELADLLAYLLSRGNPNDPAFQK